MNTEGLRTWIEVDKKRIAHNVQAIRRAIGSDVQMMGIVKSNAYGHNLVEFSHELASNGVEWLGVDSVVEALRLRKAGITIPILVLGYTLPELVEEAIDLDISLTVSSRETLETWKKLDFKKAVKIHVKVDTGLHRQGFLLPELFETIDFLEKNKKTFIVEGLYTHFAAAKDPADTAYTKSQLAEFNQWIEAFKNNNFSPVIHAAATAGALLYPEARYDMVRVGAGLYGIWPSPETKMSLGNEMSLQPALAWKTLISEIKKLPKGSGIGYNLSETLGCDSVIAICPMGYWHGYPRSLSSKGEAMICGMRAKVLGRIAMDMIVVDITDIPKVGVRDEVALINDEISAEELAEKAGTTSYEILTRLNPLIRRIFK